MKSAHDKPRSNLFDGFFLSFLFLRTMRTMAPLKSTEGVDIKTTAVFMSYRLLAAANFVFRSRSCLNTLVSNDEWLTHLACKNEMVAGKKVITIFGSARAGAG